MALPTSQGQGGNERPPGLPLPDRQKDAKDSESSSVGYPAPRGGLPAPSQAVHAPLPLPPMDDAFEALPIDEVWDEEELAEEPVLPEREVPPAMAAPQFDMFEHEAESPTTTSLTAPVTDEPQVFIDKSKGKLLPFGGSKSKSKKDADPTAAFDARENRRTKARIVQISALVGVFALVGIGGYRAVSPHGGASVTEVNAAISAAIQSNSFPMERGAAFAEDFLSAYLNIDGTNSNTGLLGYYYTGTVGSEAPISTVNSASVIQKIVVAPQVFKQSEVSSESAYYEVGAFVTTSTTTTSATPETEANGKWVFYNVNVYYSAKNDIMAITPDSPSLIPNDNLAPSTEIPDAKLPGTGIVDEKATVDTKTSLYGFMKAFAESSVFSFDALKQYVLTTQQDNPAIMQGLDGKFVLAGEPDSAIVSKAYTSGDPSIVKLDVTVQWADANYNVSTSVGANTSLVYTSHYFVEMTLSQGKWFVSNFASRYYSPAVATN